MIEEAVRGRGYRIIEKQGAGRFSIVYRAYQSAVDREVAIKVMRPYIVNDQQFISRFETEAQIAARVEHLNIVPLYDFWKDDNQAYIVMRWVAGGTMKDALAEGMLETDHVVQIANQIASALYVAHKHGVVHCAVKPSNIMLDELGNAYLTDFGLARQSGDKPYSEGMATIVGSLWYTAPEQITGEAVSPQTDIYSLGCVIFEMVAGQPPFGYSDPVSALCNHLYEPMPPVTKMRPDIPARVDIALQQAAEKDPEDRYLTALRLADEFEKSINSLKSPTN